VALNALLKLAGVKQGEIRGSVTQKGREGKIAVIAVSHEIVSPHDAASGQATGKCQHRPLVITKELDRSSVPLRQMLVNNEAAKDWELQFFRPSTSGTETQYLTIRLTNAAIASIEMQMLNNRDVDLTNRETFEEVTFVYTKIEWTWPDGGLVAADDITSVA
jgi:type VI secretion system secreted protein Hcp